MKEQMIQKISDCGIVAILRGYTTEQCLHIGEGLLKGGVSCMEITYRQGHPDSETADTIAALVRTFGTDMNVGAGTVMTPEQVLVTKQAGGQYIISPNADAEVIRRTAAEGLVSIPGCMTPTECQAAVQAGADFVKLFPISQLGVGYLKMISAPLSHIRFLAVGGVKKEEFGAYLSAGAVGFGIGNALGYSRAVESGDYTIITRCAEEHRRAFDEAKGK